MKPDPVNIQDFCYDLPEERIAQFPLKERDESKLLIYNKGIISKDIFRNITNYLPDDSLLVFNNTRVINARFLFRKESGANIEILCLEPLSPPGYDINLGSGSPVEWKCIIGNLKKWKRGSVSIPFKKNMKAFTLSAEKVSPEGEAWRIRFSWHPERLSFGEVMDSAGHTPLPPYIRREDVPDDRIRYQTIYSKIDGSVAAPTAGLHFSGKVLGSILNKGINRIELTLHVGAGTFQPVRHSNILNHEMHREHFCISKESLETLIQFDSRIIPVGTTSIRTIESLYWLGVKFGGHVSNRNESFFISQWEPYARESNISFRDSLETLLKLMNRDGLSTLNASTELMIMPGYPFRALRGIITNFHQPGSTLLLLIAAFTGEDWKKMYTVATDNNFRFLSYGDSSLILKDF